MKKCKYCYSEIDERATICPNCRKSQKSSSVKIFFIGLLVTLLICGGIGGILLFCYKDKLENLNFPFNDSKKNNYSFTDLESDLLKMDKDIKIIRKDATLIGGLEGYGYSTSKCSIEVYKFDKSSDKYKKAETNQEFILEGFDVTMKATVKNGYGYYVDPEKSNCTSELKLIENLMK